MHIPHDVWNLRCALISIGEKIKDQDAFERDLGEILDEMNNKVPDEKAGLNRVVAESNGISVEALIASPNYSTLLAEFKDGIVEEIHKKLIERFGFTNVESWAIIAQGMGLI